MKRMIGGLAAVLLVLGVARAEAGITDPLPTGFKYVHTVPGVMNNYGVGTAFYLHGDRQRDCRCRGVRRCRRGTE